MSYAPFISSSWSVPTRRKVHIGSNETGHSLCGIENRVPWLLWSFTSDYDDIEQQFFTDPDEEGCKTCGKIYRTISARESKGEKS